MDTLRQTFDDHADPRVRDWPLLGETPLNVLALTAAYLCFVLWAGPRLMSDRKPFDLRGAMLLYNSALVVLSVYMTTEILLSTTAAGYSWTCAAYNKASRSPTNTSGLRVAKVMWWYFYSKAIELIDTVLMVLRKKQKQVTFLHVFHHTSMLNIWWFVVTFTPEGITYFGPLMNSSVHVLMYSYYALATFPQLRPYLWWKRYLTQIQLLQFCIVLVHTVYQFFNNCDYPLWGKIVLSSYMLILMALFTNFYLNAYTKSKSDGAATTEARKVE